MSPNSLAAADRTNIARKIAHALAEPFGNRTSASGLLGWRDRSSLRLAESLEIWTLSSSALANLTRGTHPTQSHQRLVEYAENTCDWHLQIRGTSARATGYAHSSATPLSDGTLDWSIGRLARSKLASQLDAAVKRADARGQVHPLRTARLLSLPAHHVWVLWLDEADRDILFTVSQPPGRYRLSPSGAYTWADLVRAIARRLPELTFEAPKARPVHSALPKRSKSRRKVRRNR